MLNKKQYANSQKVYELNNDFLTYFFKNGKEKAKGPYINGKMEGEWIFFRETGQLWQVAHFKNNLKHGSWIRYDKNNNIEYEETFDHGKAVS